MKGTNTSTISYFVLCLALMVQATFTAPTSSNTKPCNDDRIINTYNKQSPNYHSYSLYSVICEKSQSGCNRENVFRTMLSQMRFIAPTSSSVPVRDCRVSMLERVWPLSGADMIKTTINNIALSITNYTLPGHIFYPGEVTRSIVEMDGKILAWTTGSGSGEYKALNEYAARDIWGSVDRKLAREIAANTQDGRASCQETVNKVLLQIKAKGARNPHIYKLSKGTANQGRTGNPTSRSDELGIAITDTKREDKKAWEIIQSKSLQIWADAIALNCPNTAVVMFGLADNIEYFFVWADARTTNGTCLPSNPSGYSSLPWGKIYSNMECF